VVIGTLGDVVVEAGWVVTGPFGGDVEEAVAPGVGVVAALVDGVVIDVVMVGAVWWTAVGAGPEEPHAVANVPTPSTTQTRTIQPNAQSLLTTASS